jgi:hypothetical protein
VVGDPAVADSPAVDHRLRQDRPRRPPPNPSTLSSVSAKRAPLV